MMRFTSSGSINLLKGAPVRLWLERSSAFMEPRADMSGLYGGFCNRLAVHGEIDNFTVIAVWSVALNDRDVGIFCKRDHERFRVIA